MNQVVIGDIPRLRDGNGVDRVEVYLFRERTRSANPGFGKPSLSPQPKSVVLTQNSDMYLKCFIFNLWFLLGLLYFSGRAALGGAVGRQSHPYP